MRTAFSLLFALEHVVPKKLRKGLARKREALYPLNNAGIALSPDVHVVTHADEARRMFKAAKSPVIWRRGAIATMLGKWNLAHLKKKAGEIPVKILSLAGLDPDRTEFSDSVMLFSQYLKLMQKRNIYLRFSDFLDEAQALKAEVPFELLNQLGGNPGRTNLQFFLGPKGTQTPLHAEMNCNIFVQVFGRKRWVMFPASATPELNPPAAGRFYFFSPLDPLPMRKQVNGPKALKGWEIILEPGDILFCPPLVWHAVENLSLSCSIGFKYNRYLQAFRISPLLFAMNMLARNPSYPSYLWQTLVKKRHPILSSR